MRQRRQPGFTFFLQTFDMALTIRLHHQAELRHKNNHHE
jgi:hypothetical protein